jgi:hypothetical protein
MPEKSARAYLRDLPNAELHLLDSSHWALETNLGDIVALVRGFLARTEGLSEIPTSVQSGWATPRQSGL